MANRSAFVVWWGALLVVVHFILKLAFSVVIIIYKKSIITYGGRSTVVGSIYTSRATSLYLVMCPHLLVFIVVPFDATCTKTKAKLPRHLTTVPIFFNQVIFLKILLAHHLFFNMSKMVKRW